MKLLAILFALTIQSAHSFVPTYSDTDSFSVKTSRAYAGQNNPRYCRYETRFNESKNVIEMRVGVVGSPVDYFGWNMPINPKDLPLSVGFTKEYRTPGVTGMVMSYDGKTLTFKKIKNDQVWNRLYPFSVEVDANL